MGSLIGQRLLLHLKEDNDAPRIERSNLSEWKAENNLQMESLMSKPRNDNRHPPDDLIPESSVVEM